jgi:hypothetical protein
MRSDHDGEARTLAVRLADRLDDHRPKPRGNKAAKSACCCQSSGADPRGRRQRFRGGALGLRGAFWRIVSICGRLDRHWALRPQVAARDAVKRIELLDLTCEREPVCVRGRALRAGRLRRGGRGTDGHWRDAESIPFDGSVNRGNAAIPDSSHRDLSFLN